MPNLEAVGPVKLAAGGQPEVNIEQQRFNLRHLYAVTELLREDAVEQVVVAICGEIPCKGTWA